jgi:ribosomal protein L11 methylase PrmA
VRPEDRVVDVGSGSGRLSLEAMRLGARCVAVDPDWPAAVACRAAGIDVVQASVNALRSGACDGVLANLHLALWRDVAGEIRRVARKGAWVVASGFLDEQEAEARSLVTRVDRIVRRDGWLGLAGTL